MEMIENNSSKVPRSETEDSQSEYPQKKTRMDDALRPFQEVKNLSRGLVYFTPQCANRLVCL